jgi:ATP-dependent helicase YprA (DUF1998 family)
MVRCWHVSHLGVACESDMLYSTSRYVCGPRYIMHIPLLPCIPFQSVTLVSSVLQDACAEATTARGYSSEETCSEITSAFKDAFNGLELYNWQLDICEALLLGLDCIAIAGTGAGKTMSFIMPLLVDPTKKKVVIVILPLNALEHDQVRCKVTLLTLILTVMLTQAGRFNKIRLRATAVNRDV